MFWIIIGFVISGFLTGAACTAVWGGRGALAGLAAGFVAGMSFAFIEALVVIHPPMSETYTQYPSFATVSGLIWVLTWWIGAAFGTPLGFALRHGESGT